MPQTTAYPTILYKNRKSEKSDYLPYRKPKNAAGKLRINKPYFSVIALTVIGIFAVFTEIMLISHI